LNDFQLNKSSIEEKNNNIIFLKEKPKKRKPSFKRRDAKMQGRRGTSRLYTLAALSARSLSLLVFLLVLGSFND